MALVQDVLPVANATRASMALEASEVQRGDILTCQAVATADALSLEFTWTDGAQTGRLPSELDDDPLLYYTQEHDFRPNQLQAERRRRRT